MTTRVAAIMTCHNRRELSLSCLSSLRAQRGLDGVAVDAYLVDDGSSDGTAAAVAEQFPETNVLMGDGSLFWNGGMRRAFAAAMAGDYDHYLWLNDDTSIDDDALRKLLDTHAEVSAAGASCPIVTGSTRDPVTGRLTYGGVRRTSRFRRLRFDLIPPGSRPVQAETMNGNITLVPRSVVRRVGNIDAAYVHSMGDFDYGLRARAAGCSVWIAPDTAGTCAQNPPWDAERVTLGSLWRRMLGTKDLPTSAWSTFARRWAGPLWPIYFISPYLQRSARMTVKRLL